MKKNPSTANPPSGETKQNNPETSRNLKFLLFFYKTRFKDRCGSSDDIERVFFLDVTKTNRSRLANLKKSRSISVEPATWKVGKGRRVMGGGGGRGGGRKREGFKVTCYSLFRVQSIEFILTCSNDNNLIKRHQYYSMERILLRHYLI